MPQQTLANRVAILENQMQSLEGLPDRVASLEVQISQFRAEVRVEFSAVRGEMRDLAETLRGEMHNGISGLAETLRGEMHNGISGLAETLRGEIRAGDEETRRQMRVLHEEVISRIALLDETLNGRKRSQESRGRAGHSRRPPKGR